jgi:hypothetical protein
MSSASAVSTSWLATIEPAWLTEVLRATGAVDATVARVETEPLEVASAAGELARLSLAYEPIDAPGPATIIAKAPGTSEIQRAMDAAMGLFARERFVYRELADALPVRLPRCHHAGDADKQEPMLLEDLRGLRIAMLGQMSLQGGDARGLADTLVLRTLTHAGELDAFATL